MVFYNYSTKDLYYAENSGSSWNILLIPEDNTIAENLTDIAVDSSGIPYIGYNTGSMKIVYLTP